MIKLLGLIGGFCFAYCGVPVAIASFSKGGSIGTPVSVAWMILVGAVAMYAYLYLSYGFDWLLAINYSVEALSWGVVLRYHYLPRS